MKGKPMLIDKAGYRYRKAQHTPAVSKKYKRSSNAP
jgi:hypothetical protein